jgi:hypothetical protein
MAQNTQDIPSPIFLPTLSATNEKIKRPNSAPTNAKLETIVFRYYSLGHINKNCLETGFLLSQILLKAGD